jgi:predicted RNA-binding protein with PUA-like domain
LLQGYDGRGRAVNARVYDRAMWLLKTEPSTYGWADLEREGRTRWDGVRNPVAQKNLRAMKEGDEVVVYHTGDERRAVGRARVVKAAYPDPKEPALVAVDLEAIGPLARPVTLEEMKKSAAFADSPLLRQGRLAVVPLTKAQWKEVVG